MSSDHAREAEEDRQREEEEYNSFLYKFEQQIIDAWKPVPYTRNNVILYSILTVICIGLGLALILTNSSYQQIEKEYGGKKQPTNGIVRVNFSLDQTLPQPIYLYYGLSNFYQNHRRYLKFFSPEQMNGQSIDLATATSECGDQADTNDKIKAFYSFNNKSLNGGDPAYPCGQRAKSFLEISPELESMDLQNSDGVSIQKTKVGISWPDDKKAYKDSGNPDIQAISNQNETWLVWYRPAAQNFFFKLHSIITEDLHPGNYTFLVNDIFDLNYGTKYFHLSKANYMGNKDYLLGIAFLVLGGGCLVVLIVFIAKCVTEMRGKAKDD